jgi:hypothetical protein
MMAKKPQFSLISMEKTPRFSRCRANNIERLGVAREYLNASLRRSFFN